ncbi:MAG: helix-turn-helix domain-containing protein [Caulobacteraceae bacterium]
MVRRRPAGSAPGGVGLSLGECMALFFDADWFDQRLAARGLDRVGLAVAAGVDRGELHRIFTHERSPTAAEMAEFARVLDVDLSEITIRSGVAIRESAPGAGHGDRIESIEARLDAIDTWLAEFEASKKKAVGD